MLLKVWNGSSYVRVTAIKKWDGTQWVHVPVKYWDGSKWIIENRNVMVTKLTCGLPSIFL